MGAGGAGRADPVAPLRGLPLWQVCDLAEVLWRREQEAEDMLHLLAGLGGAKDYEPPGDRIAEALGAAGPARDPEARRAEVARFTLIAGGDG